MKPHKRIRGKAEPPAMILVTAGPTREKIDPVRYISNISTGRMGCYIAAKLIKKGFSVCLVTGPSGVPPPEGAEVARVMSAGEMSREVRKRVDSCRAVIMAAAVCDLRPERARKGKIKTGDRTELAFVRNPDILKSIGERPDLVKVGFALETGGALRNGWKKLKDKGLDLIIVNAIGKGSDPFGDGRCDYTFLYRDRSKKEFTFCRKEMIAGEIAGETEKLLAKKQPWPGNVS